MMWSDPGIAGHVGTAPGRARYCRNGAAERTGGAGHYRRPLHHDVVLCDQLDTGKADRPGDPAFLAAVRFFLGRRLP
jgi:hypothetical protein